MNHSIPTSRQHRVSLAAQRHALALRQQGRQPHDNHQLRSSAAASASRRSPINVPECSASNGRRSSSRQWATTNTRPSSPNNMVADRRGFPYPEDCSTPYSPPPTKSPGKISPPPSRNLSLTFSISSAATLSWDSDTSAGGEKAARSPDDAGHAVAATDHFKTPKRPIKAGSPEEGPQQAVLERDDTIEGILYEANLNDAGGETDAMCVRSVRSDSVSSITRDHFSGGSFGDFAEQEDEMKQGCDEQHDGRYNMPMHRRSRRSSEQAEADDFFSAVSFASRAVLPRRVTVRTPNVKAFDAIDGSVSSLGDSPDSSDRPRGSPLPCGSGGDEHSPQASPQNASRHTERSGSASPSGSSPSSGTSFREAARAAALRARRRPGLYHEISAGIADQAWTTLSSEEESSSYKQSSAAEAGRTSTSLGDESDEDPFDEGMAYLAAGYYPGARSRLKSSLKRRIRANDGDEGHADVGEVREQLAVASAGLGDIAGAMQHGSLALRSLTSISPLSSASSSPSSAGSSSEAAAASDKRIAAITLRMADLFFECGEFSPALEYYSRHSTICECLPDFGRGSQRSSSSSSLDATRKLVYLHEAMALAAHERLKHELALFHYRQMAVHSFFLRRHGASLDDHDIAGNGGRLSSRGGRGARLLAKRLKSLRSRSRAYASDGRSRRRFSIVSKPPSPREEDDAGGLTSPVLQAMLLLRRAGNDADEALERCEGHLVALKAEIEDGGGGGGSKSIPIAIAHTRLQMGFLQTMSGRPLLAVRSFRRSFRTLRKAAGALPVSDVSSSERSLQRGRAANLQRLIALSYLAIGRDALAVRWYKRCLRSCSKDRAIDVLVIMGIIHGRNGNARKAVKYFVKAVRTCIETQEGGEEEEEGGGVTEELLLPHIQDLLLDINLPSDTLGSTEEGGAGAAASPMEQAREAQDAANVLEYWGLAILNRRSSKHAKICTLETSAILRYPPDSHMKASFLHAMGNLLFRRRRFSESCAFYERCLSAPQLTYSSVGGVAFELLSNLGNAYLKTADTEKAKICCRDAMRMLQESFDGGRGGEAEDAESAAADFRELETELRQMRANLLNSSPDEDAGVSFSSLESSVEGEIHSAHLKCFALCREGRYDEAIALLHAIIKDVKSTIGTDRPADAIHLTFDLCLAYLLKGDTRTARPLLRTAQRLWRGVVESSTEDKPGAEVGGFPNPLINWMEPGLFE